MTTGLAPRAVGHLVQAAVTVVLAVTAMHLLLALAPGDAIDLLPNAEVVRAQLTAEWGLDRPWWSRVLATLRGDLGVSTSVQPGRPVIEIIGSPMWRSITLWFASGTLLCLLSVGLAWVRTGIPRAVIAAVSIVPIFLLAHGVNGGLNDATFAAIQQGLIERPGWFALPLEPSWVRTVLAATVLALGSAAFADASTEARAHLTRQRRSMLALAAKNRGEPEYTWLWRHLAVFACDLIQSRAPVLLGALVITEKVFLMRGAGTLLWDAAVARDAPLALALTGLFAVAVAVVRAGTTITRDVITRGQVPQ